jgi:ornithine cyclodeaminase/alanine dehydrogenase-like protein (mu-crystallin family)
MLHLDDDAVANLLDPTSVTEAVADAFTAWGRGEAATTQRVRAAAAGLMSSAMAAAVPPFSGGKLYATTNGVFTFVIVLFDAEGRFVCTLDGDVITRLRTPAASALAIRALAAPNSTTAALVGSGRQAWSHLQMLAGELPGLERVAVAARRASAADELVARAQAAGIPAVRVDDPATAVAGADVVVTVTASTEPLFGAGDIGDRTLLCAVGATKYDRRELDSATVAKCAAVVCDDVAGSRTECGDLIAAVTEGRFSWERAVELHDVLAGNVAVPRAGAAPVLFETQGVALQDVAVAALAYQRYVARPASGIRLPRQASPMTTIQYPSPVPGRNDQ